MPYVVETIVRGILVDTTITDVTDAQRRAEVAIRIWPDAIIHVRPLVIVP